MVVTCIYLFLKFGSYDGNYTYVMVLIHFIISFYTFNVPKFVYYIPEDGHMASQNM
jgi:hypothetical protein